MVKKDTGPGCLMYLFLIVVIAIMAAFIFLSNTLNLKTLFTYGPSQYFSNIVHFHRDYYCRVSSPIKIYEDILSTDSLDGSEDKNLITTLKPGKVFKLKGYRSKQYVTWVAAKVANGSELIYGYFVVPNKIKLNLPTFWTYVDGLWEKPNPFSNKYFSEIPSESTKQYRKTLFSTYKTKLRQIVKLKSSNDSVEMQKIKESKEFKIIDKISSDTTVYYCPASDHKKAEGLWEAYLGSGFDRHYLQISGTYDPN
jgi:hypothetical protein